MNLGTLRDETRTAIEAVQLAAAVTMARVGVDQTTNKGARDIVTAVDVAVEDLLVDFLRTRFPSIPVIGEERGGAAGDNDGHWLVDPICGTRNFASDIPQFCNNIALVENGEPVVAVVGDPTRQRVFVAERGRGAWLIGDGVATALAVSDSSGAVCVEDALADGPRRLVASRFVAELIASNRWYTRAYGSSLSAVYVAAGQLAAYLVFMCDSPVHLAAGALLVAEAGGLVTDLDGNAWDLNSDTLLTACDLRVQATLLEIVRSVSV